MTASRTTGSRRDRRRARAVEPTDPSGARRPAAERAPLASPPPAPAEAGPLEAILDAAAPALPPAPDAAGDAPVPVARPAFAHASEAEMARILDFYRVRWEYEPHTFPILWNLDGAVVESFAPDFWLPDLDLYLEMTTLRQKLVRKKNRKLRRVLELYPDLRVKLFYARDFRALMLKFGRLALFDDLAGTSGQVVPDRLGTGPIGPADGAGPAAASPDATIGGGDG